MIQHLIPVESDRENIKAVDVKNNKLQLEKKQGG